MTTETALREKLKDMADQLQIIEMADGLDYLLGLPLYHEKRPPPNLWEWRRLLDPVFALDELC